MKLFRPEVADKEPSLVADFVDDFQWEFSNYRGREKREQERTETSPIPAEVQPLGDDFQPIGESFHAIIRNVSKSGIGLLFCEPVDTNFFSIQAKAPSGAVLKAVLAVRHRMTAGAMIGGAFVESQPPSIE